MNLLVFNLMTYHECTWRQDPWRCSAFHPFEDEQKYCGFHHWWGESDCWGFRRRRDWRGFHWEWFVSCWILQISEWWELGTSSGQPRWDLMKLVGVGSAELSRTLLHQHLPQLSWYIMGVKAWGKDYLVFVNPGLPLHLVAGVVGDGLWLEPNDEELADSDVDSVAAADAVAAEFERRLAVEIHVDSESAHSVSGVAGWQLVSAPHRSPANRYPGRMHPIDHVYSSFQILRRHWMSHNLRNLVEWETDAARMRMTVVGLSIVELLEHTRIHQY